MDIEALAARLAKALAGEGDGAREGEIVARDGLLEVPGDPLSDYLRRTLPPGGRGLVLPRLTGETVCQVWAGVCLTPLSRQVFEALSRGERVWVPREGLELGQGPMGRLARERLEVLRRSGLTICPLGELGERRERGEDGGAGPGEGYGVVYPKKRGAGRL